MPSQKAKTKAAMALVRLAKTKGIGAAVGALNKRRSQLTNDEYSRALELIKSGGTKAGNWKASGAQGGRNKGGIIRRNSGGPVMANRGGIFKQPQPMQKGSPYRGILMNKFNRRQ